MNTDGVFRTWHHGLDMIYPLVLSSPYGNSVPNIPETSLQIGDWLNCLRSLTNCAVAIGVSYGDQIEISYIKKSNCYHVPFESDSDSQPVRDLQIADGKITYSREHYSFNWDKSGLLMSVNNLFNFIFLEQIPWFLYEVISLFNIFFFTHVKYVTWCMWHNVFLLKIPSSKTFSKFSSTVTKRPYCLLKYHLKRPSTKAF